MTATLHGGPIVWGLDRDEEGHRTFNVSFLAHTTDTADGPYKILTGITGLPIPGESYWAYGNDVDTEAICSPATKLSLWNHVEGDPHHWWRFDYKFSTKRNTKRCQDTNVTDPLMEPDRVSGSFNKYTKEVMTDKDGKYIRSSSHEIIRGAQVEFDHNRPTVRIEQNRLLLGLDEFSQMIDGVNDVPMWGLPERTIKLSNVSWERKLYGVCSYYYTRTFEFDIDYATFDKAAMDEGTKVLNGRWGSDGSWELTPINSYGLLPDPNNPAHFMRMKDRNGENMKVILDGFGQPLLDPDAAVYRAIKYYPSVNLFSLDLPASF